MEFVTIYIVSNCILTRIINKRHFSAYKNYKVIDDFRDIYACYFEMQKKKADIIFLESELSYTDEIKYIKKIKKEFPDVKIIIKTTQKNKEKILSVLACNISGYITNNNMDIKKITNIVLEGGFWLDTNIAEIVFSSADEINLKINKEPDKDLNVKNNLTQRELEVLKLITEGKTNSQIAQEIIVSTNTAKAHVGSILTKLSVNDRVQAAVKAIKANLF